MSDENQTVMGCLRDGEASQKSAETSPSVSVAPTHVGETLAAPARCPFPHTNSQADPPSPQITAKCPYPHNASSEAAVATASSTSCPYTGTTHPTPENSSGSGTEDSRAREQPVGPSLQEASEKLSKCPMGYGGGGAGSLDPLNCAICRTLYYDAAAAACGHQFCSFCIQSFQDCPLCGADCQPLAPARQLQDTVDKHIEMYSTNHQPLEQVLPSSPSAEADRASLTAPRATFLLQLGLRSFAGGNLEAAIHHMTASEQDLLQQQQQQQQQEQNNSADCEHVSSAAVCPVSQLINEQLSVQLGAICGSLGDCHRRLGNLETALQKYRESVEHLQSCSRPSDEVKHALSVSTNKLGDLLHSAGDVSAALKCYEGALLSRRQLVIDNGAAEKCEQWAVAQLLDLAVSLIKVAHAHMALDEPSHVEEFTTEAQKLAELVAARAKPEDKGLTAKLKGLQTFLAELQ